MTLWKDNALVSRKRMDYIKRKMEESQREREQAERVSEGRRKRLFELEKENRENWIRAERAEGECHRLEKENQRLLDERQAILKQLAETQTAIVVLQKAIISAKPECVCPTYDHLEGCWIGARDVALSTRIPQRG